MGILRKFVKGNHNSEKKKDEPLKILAKFKNNKNKWVKERVINFINMIQ